MTILFGLITALIVEAIKKIKAKFGNAFGTTIIYLIILAIAIAWTLLTTLNIISTETINKILTIVASAIATYEIILKRLSVLTPIDGSESGEVKK
jgi:uncharacterized membrane protein